MANPSIIPEAGVGIYEHDRTQGPLAAMACGGGTIVRNYFVELGHQIGQTKHLQVDCLEELGKFLGNKNHELWETKNGYAFASQQSLLQIQEHLGRLNPEEYEICKRKLKIGVQWNTEVVESKDRHNVTQVFCSGLPLGYSDVEIRYWEPFARLILEATFFAAKKNDHKTGNPKLYLTLVGGGVFGNDLQWILDAIKMAVTKFKTTPLEVAIVSYHRSKPEIADFVRQFDDNTSDICSLSSF